MVYNLVNIRVPSGRLLRADRAEVLPRCSAAPHLSPRRPPPRLLPALSLLRLPATLYHRFAPCVCVCVCVCVCMDFFVFVSMWVLTRTETVRFCGESRDPASTRAMRILANECHKIGPTTSARCGAVRHHGVLCLLQRLPGNPAHDVCAGAGRPARARDDRHWYVMPRCARLGCDRVHLRVSRWCCFVSFLALRRVPRLPIPPLPLP